MPLVRNRIFFHGANVGIGDMMETLNQNGIAFTGKSIANVGFVNEMIQYSKDYNIDNTIILRYVDTPEYPQLVPDYTLPPEQAAGNVCQSLLNHLSIHALELYDSRDYFRVEVGNELRTKDDPDDPNYDGMNAADWLGYYGCHFSRMMKANGWKTFMFGMNAGTPEVNNEPSDWLLPGMVQFLQLCASEPDYYGLSLHEGFPLSSNPDVDLPSNYEPWMIGRVKFVTDACVQIGIEPPLTVISEWAWYPDKLPPYDKVVSDIEYISEYYAQYQNVLGVCLWNLDNNCGECANLPSQLTNLIPFVQDYTLNTWHDVEFYNPTPPPVNDREQLLQAAIDNQAIYTIHDAALLKAIVADGRIVLSNEFNYTWCDGTNYVCQYAYDIQEPDTKLVYKVPVGDWGNVTVEVYE